MLVSIKNSEGKVFVCTPQNIIIQTDFESKKTMFIVGIYVIDFCTKSEQELVQLISSQNSSQRTLFAKKHFHQVTDALKFIDDFKQNIAKEIVTNYLQAFEDITGLSISNIILGFKNKTENV